MSLFDRSCTLLTLFIRPSWKTREWRQKSQLENKFSCLKPSSSLVKGLKFIKALSLMESGVGEGGVFLFDDLLFCRGHASVGLLQFTFFCTFGDF